MSWQDFRVQKRLGLPPQSIEEIYALLSEIDGLKSSWQITGNLLPQTLERLTRSVIITSTGSSNCSGPIL